MKNIALCLIGLALLAAGVVAGCQSTQTSATSAPAASEPATMYYGNGGRAKPIVYIIDCSESMRAHFDDVRKELKSSTSKLAPIQLFALVLISDDVKVIAGEDGKLMRATPENVKAFGKAIDELHAGRTDNGRQESLEHAFEAAIAFKPELIYFMTGDVFERKLLDDIDTLCADRKIKIDTLSFLNPDPALQSVLREMAKTHGGKFKVVEEKDLGK